MIELENGNCLDYIKKLPDCSIDLIFADPPYNLSSQVYIKENGKPDLKKAKDFMDKWSGLDGEFLEEFYKECLRVLKYGGHCLLFGIDRQLFMFEYYANLSGFTQKQSLYWYFISNFPKASDLSKNLDKYFGAERDVVGDNIRLGDKKSYVKNSSVDEGWNAMQTTGKITSPSTDLAKKYNGLKYSVAPLKQTNETIMVFQKPYKTGSCLHDVLAMENGDKTITCGGVDIEGNRCGIETIKTQGGDKFPNNYGTFNTAEETLHNGRFPAQTYIDSGAPEIIDLQSGKMGMHPAGNKKDVEERDYNASSYKFGTFKHNPNYYKDTKESAGKASRILHKCDFEIRTIQAKIIYKESGFYEIKIDPKYKYLVNSNDVIFDGETFGLNLSHFPEVKSYKFYHENLQTEMIDGLLMPVMGSSADLIIDLKGEICDYEAGDYDLYHYCPKVSKSERNEGLEGFEEKQGGSYEFRTDSSLDGKQTQKTANNHPTVKPKALLSKILKLFKTPNQQVILDPFMGSGSMGISAVETGFDYIGYELDPEYFKIAEARIANTQSKADERLL